MKPRGARYEPKYPHWHNCCRHRHHPSSRIPDARNPYHYDRNDNAPGHLDGADDFSTIDNDPVYYRTDNHPAIDDDTVNYGADNHPAVDDDTGSIEPLCCDHPTAGSFIGWSRQQSAKRFPFRPTTFILYCAYIRSKGSHMKDIVATMNAEFQGSDVSVLSTDPLLGTVELTSSTGGTIEVLLDRYSAEALLSALVQFLAHGNDDAQASWLQ